MTPALVQSACQNGLADAVPFEIVAPFVSPLLPQFDDLVMPLQRKWRYYMSRTGRSHFSPPQVMALWSNDSQWFSLDLEVF
eukprot:scaffold334380_cov18-Prasinocladus_malaysianus.AAC.1